MRRFLMLAAMAGLLGSSLARAADEAEPPPPKTVEDLDARIADLQKDKGDAAAAPAVFVHLIENGETVFSKGYGVVDRDFDDAPTADTVFRIGSISKTFLALAALMLAEEGKLDLNARLADIAPEVPLDNRWEEQAPVRFVHLLEHTAGWPDITLGEFAQQVPRADLEEAVIQHRPFKSRYAPGLYFSYANGGYAVAGYILEKAAGETYEDYVRRRIFEPLGLTSASFFWEERYETEMAKGYLPDGSLAPYDHIRDWPAGSISMSARDLMTFAKMLEQRGVHDGLALVTQDAIERMERAESTRAEALGLIGGYGLGNAPISGTKAIWRGHDGGIGTYASSMGYLPGSGKAYVAFSASEDVDPQMLQAIVQFLERDLPSPMPEEIAADPATLKAFTGFYQRFPGRQPLTALIESLTFERVTVKDGRLIVSGLPRAMVSERIIRRQDRPFTSHALIEEADGQRLIVSRLGALRQASIWEVGAKAAYGTVAVALLLATFVYAMVWGIGAGLGRLNERGGALPRVAALAAMMAPYTLVVVLAVNAGGPTAVVIQTLGNPGLVTWTIYALSLLWPALGVLTLVAGLWAPRLGTLQRAYVIAVGLVVAGGALYAAHYGWIGQKTWA